MDLTEQIAAVVRQAVVEAMAQDTRPRALNLEESARYLGGTTPKVVKHLIESGELPALRVGNRFYVGTGQLDALLARGAVVRTARAG